MNKDNIENKASSNGQASDNNAVVIKKIYERYYDGTHEGFSDEARPNRLLGTFEVINQIFDDFYAEKFIGVRQEDGKTYFVEGVEISGMYNPKNGGTRWSITEISL